MPGRQKGGAVARCLSALRDCIARGLEATKEARTQVQSEMALARPVVTAVDAAVDGYDERVERFDALLEQYKESASEVAKRLARRMNDWRLGLFIGDGEAERRTDPCGRPLLPEDNYGIERSFRLPKGHARHIHGRAHAGVALVQRGATLIPTLDAHALHSGPFSEDDLRPYFDALEPAAQREVRQRAQVMKKARSEKQRPLLLKEFEKQFMALP